MRALLPIEPTEERASARADEAAVRTVVVGRDMAADDRAEDAAQNGAAGGIAATAHNALFALGLVGIVVGTVVLSGGRLGRHQGLHLGPRRRAILDHAWNSPVRRAH